MNIHHRESPVGIRGRGIHCPQDPVRPNLTAANPSVNKLVSFPIVPTRCVPLSTPGCRKLTFLQYNPYYGVHWGSTTWGHAINTDRSHWPQQPDKIHPDESATILWGSGMVDWENTTGWPTGEHPPLIALHTPAGGWNPQSCGQAIADSTDRGAQFHNLQRSTGIRLAITFATVEGGQDDGTTGLRHACWFSQERCPIVEPGACPMCPPSAWRRRPALAPTGFMGDTIRSMRPSRMPAVVMMCAWASPSGRRSNGLSGRMPSTASRPSISCTGA